MLLVYQIRIGIKYRPVPHNGKRQLWEQAVQDKISDFVKQKENWKPFFKQAIILICFQLLCRRTATGSHSREGRRGVRGARIACARAFLSTLERATLRALFHVYNVAINLYIYIFKYSPLSFLCTVKAYSSCIVCLGSSEGEQVFSSNWSAWPSCHHTFVKQPISRITFFANKILPPFGLSLKFK